MKDQSVSVKDLLNEYYGNLKKQNSGKYSLRSFAKDLGISPGRLSSFYQQSNIPSLKTVDKIARQLKLNADEKKRFLVAIDNDKKRRLVQRADVIIKKEDMHVVTDWVPYAILSLLLIKGFSLSASSVAERLGISVAHAEACINKLISLGLIEMEQGQWKPIKKKISTEIDIPSEHIRKSHEEKMQLSIQRMHEVPVELRDYSSITFPVDLNNLATAKKMLIDFRRSLAEQMQWGTPSEIYLLNLQLFPLTRSSSKGQDA